jgi:hypothetical protein
MRFSAVRLLTNNKTKRGKKTKFKTCPKVENQKEIEKESKGM